jgi:hypothetical protein
MIDGVGLTLSHPAGLFLLYRLFRGHVPYGASTKRSFSPKKINAGVAVFRANIR